MSESTIGSFLELSASAQVSVAWVQSMAEYQKTTPHYSLLDLFRPLFLNKEAKGGLMWFLHIPSHMDWLPQNEDGRVIQGYAGIATTHLFSCSVALGWMQLEHAIYLSKLDVEQMFMK